MPKKVKNPRCKLLIETAMNKKGLSITETNAELSKVVRKRFSFEHMRKLAHGIQKPSYHIILPLAKVLNISAEDLKIAAAEDDIEASYEPEILSKITKKNPELTRIELAWGFLTPDQKNTIYTMVEAFTGLNK